MKWRVQLDNDVKCNENLSNASCSVIGQQNTLLRLTVIRSDECVWVVIELKVKTQYLHLDASHRRSHKPHPASVWLTALSLTLNERRMCYLCVRRTKGQVRFSSVEKAKNKHVRRHYKINKGKKSNNILELKGF